MDHLECNTVDDRYKHTKKVRALARGTSIVGATLAVALALVGNPTVHIRDDHVSLAYHYERPRMQTPLIWKRPRLQYPPIFDTIFFDVDGVLIKTTDSFRATDIAVAEYVVAHIHGLDWGQNEGKPLVTIEDVNA